MCEDGNNDYDEEELVRRWLPVECGNISVEEGLKVLGMSQRIEVTTAYKKKKDKVRPLDQATDGEGNEGDPQYFEKYEKLEMNQDGPYDRWITPKFSTIVRGSRITEE